MVIVLKLDFFDFFCMNVYELGKHFFFIRASQNENWWGGERKNVFENISNISVCPVRRKIF